MRDSTPASTLTRWATYALLLTMPTSVFWSLAPPHAPDVLPLYVTRGFYLSDIPLLLLLVLSLIRGRFHTAGRLGLMIPLLGQGLLGLLTAPAAFEPVLALYTAMRWLLAFALALWLVQAEIPHRSIIAILAAGLCLQTLIGLAQVAVQGPLGLPGELALPPAVRGAAIIEANGDRWLRPYGLTFHPNVLAGYLAVALILLLPFLSRSTDTPTEAYARASRVTHHASPWPARIACALLATGLLLTFSRAAWLAALVALPLTALHLAAHRPEMRRELTFLLAGGGLLALVVGFLWREQLITRLYPLLLDLVSGGDWNVLSRAARSEQFSLGERDILNLLALRFIRERPLYGVGAGNFPLAMSWLQDSGTPQFVHNVPLLLAAEVGLLGGLFWILLGVAIVLCLVLAWRKADSHHVAALAAALALFIIALFDSYPWALQSGLMLTAVVLGLAARPTR